MHTNKQKDKSIQFRRETENSKGEIHIDKQRVIKWEREREERGDE